MPFTVKTERGGEKLVDDENNIYRIDRKLPKKYLWKCEERNCKARVHTTIDKNSQIVIVKVVGMHSHSSNPTKPKVNAALASLKMSARASSLSTRAQLGEATENLNTEGMIMLPSISTLSRNVRGWRQVNQQAPPIPKSR